MFEKEAEEIANKKLCSERICYNHCNFNSPKHHRCGEWHRIYDCAKESAEFGYNKANEWHYMKDGDLPKVGQKCYFIYSNFYREDNKVIFQNLVSRFLQVFTLLFLTKKQVTKQQKLVFMTI